MRDQLARTGNVRLEDTQDPRSRLVREKYFTLRPKPLERWLWGQGIPASAERIFWLHWEEGMRRGDWCSQIPLRRVAQECALDVSTVTRAYQWLIAHGCLRRTDPGRDPANPFQQATALTEVRVPRELLTELPRHPSRLRRVPAAAPEAQGRAPAAAPERLPEAPAATLDPFPGLRGRERLRALQRLLARLSAAERRRYEEAFRTSATQLEFDADTVLSPEERGAILQMLTASAQRTPAAANAPAANPGPAQPRRLTDFELARLRREIQSVTSTADASELLRQVAWSIEAGALKRFSPLHAMHIALKKIREGAWTRPHRLPPHWSRAPGAGARPEACTRA